MDWLIWVVISVVAVIVITLISVVVSSTRRLPPDLQQTIAAIRTGTFWQSQQRLRARLVRWRSGERASDWTAPRVVTEQPYRFAQFTRRKRQYQYLDLAGDADVDYLQRAGLPVLRTPEDIAQWLKISPGELLWLTHGGTRHVAPTVQQSHYSYRWLKKRTGGHRLVEAPKTRLKQVQRQILRGILASIPPHPAAHGFVPGRSIRTHAALHVGQPLVVKMDLSNFYSNIKLRRVIAILRSTGYSREAAIWLGRLLTTRVPTNAPYPPGDVEQLNPYFSPHLPQGAPTSPALANLSAFWLDVRLSGLAKSFGVRYSRYADDLTFSGGEAWRKNLRLFLPLVRQIVRSERFVMHPGKTRVMRRGTRQSITGLVVNDRLNVPRADYDTLKAILYNCVKHGPQSQNREQVPNFAARLSGQISYIRSIHPARGAKLLALFRQIPWPPT